LWLKLAAVSGRRCSWAIAFFGLLQPSGEIKLNYTNRMFRDIFYPARDASSRWAKITPFSVDVIFQERFPLNAIAFDWASLNRFSVLAP
jgi:hypothetical protein